jgi:serine phosphatase RsbU (regulator of sigma subunit)
LNSIGVIYVQQEKLDSAKKYLFEALKNREEIGDEEGVALSLINISEYYVARKNITKAKESAERAYEICKELGLPEDVEMSAEMLSQIHKDLKNYKEGWGFYEVYIETRDSLRSKENITGIVEQNAQFDFDKKQAVNEAEHKKDLEISKEKEKNQQFITFAVVVILLLVIISLIIILKRLKITRKQKEVIEYQKQEIVDSITYAKRIQEAILPTESFIKEQLPNSFVYYKPKDIIAGDFYWVEAYTPKDKTESPLVLFAAADCTGHGVPGAMVSVVCNNALNAAVREHKLIDPGQILDKTREIVVEQFNKSRTTTISNIRDGMDIALCALNIKTNEIHYSGAYNPLWIIRKGAANIEEVKANRHPIGKTDKLHPYKTHSVQLNKGDQIYLFSDGFADQFGGGKGKKMMHRRFKELLISVSEDSIENKNKKIDAYFKNWMGTHEQIDDVCIIGVEI